MTFDGRVEHGPSANTTDLSYIIDEDEIVRIEIVGKRKVYSEASYNKVVAQRDRLRNEMRRYLPVIERCERLPALWAWCTNGTGIATANGYMAALKEAGDE